MDDKTSAPTSITLTLPPLTTEQAILLWTLLDDLASAVWDAYEQRMVEVFQREAELHIEEPLGDSDDIPL